MLIAETEDWDNPLLEGLQRLFYNPERVRMPKKDGKSNRYTVDVMVIKPDGTRTVYGSRKAASDALGVSPNAIGRYMELGGVPKKGAKHLQGYKVERAKRKEEIFAMYVDDELKAIGTLKELAEASNLSVETIKYYHYSKSRDNRTAVIKLEGDE